MSDFYLNIIISVSIAFTAIIAFLKDFGYTRGKKSSPSPSDGPIEPGEVITTVNSILDLPKNPSKGQIFHVLNDHGNKWIPGGNYSPSGKYVYDGESWVKIEKTGDSIFDMMARSMPIAI